MTRFARAKGSKSSNEKLPEEGTPWTEMKKGLLMKQDANTEGKLCISKYKSQAKEVKPLEWFSLDDENEDCLNLLKKHLKKDVKAGGKQEGALGSGKKSKKQKKHKCEENEDNEDKDEVNALPFKKMKKVKNFTNVNVGLDNIRKKSKERKITSNILDEVNKEGNKLDKLKKRKRKNNELAEECGLKNSLVVKKRKIKKSDSQSKMICEENVEDGNSMEITKTKDESTSKKGQVCDKVTKKAKKIIMKANARRQVENKFKSNGNKFTTKIDIGGEMVTLIKYQGFYVTKDDAKRLKDMKRKMQQEGIPQTQIESVIKLERRKCEKSLARMRKNVCFQCRKPGHLLSQCPEMKDNIDTGTGVCYKCGSTEHKAFTCKVKHAEKFPFAECFICKEKGHIARECPDNPRGLYPNGGCCKLCGDVTHLKKDCPTKMLENEEKTVKVGVRDDRNLEGLEEIVEKQETGNRKKQKKRAVIF